MGPSVRVITNTSFATKNQNCTHTNGEWSACPTVTVQQTRKGCLAPSQVRTITISKQPYCNTFLRFDWLNHAQTTEYSWQCVPVPAVTSPQGRWGGGLAHSSWCRFWLGKTKTKNRGWESWLGALLWKSQLSGHSFAHIISKPTQTQRPTKTALVQNITLSCCLRPSGLIEMAITACTLQNQQAKILAVVACSAILTYVTLVS